MRGSDMALLLLKCLLLIILVFAILGDPYEPISPSVKMLIAALALLEIFIIVRKLDRRRG